MPADTASLQAADYQADMKRLKKELKEWEADFLNEYGRKPEKKDIVDDKDICMYCGYDIYCLLHYCTRLTIPTLNQYLVIYQARKYKLYGKLKTQADAKPESSPSKKSTKSKAAAAVDENDDDTDDQTSRSTKTRSKKDENADEDGGGRSKKDKTKKKSSKSKSKKEQDEELPAGLTYSGHTRSMSARAAEDDAGYSADPVAPSVGDVEGAPAGDYKYANDASTRKTKKSSRNESRGRSKLDHSETYDNQNQDEDDILNSYREEDEEQQQTWSRDAINRPVSPRGYDNHYNESRDRDEFNTFVRGDVLGSEGSLDKGDFTSTNSPYRSQDTMYNGDHDRRNTNVSTNDYYNNYHSRETVSSAISGSPAPNSISASQQSLGRNSTSSQQNSRPWGSGSGLPENFKIRRSTIPIGPMSTDGKTYSRPSTAQTATDKNRDKADGDNVHLKTFTSNGALNGVTGDNQEYMDFINRRNRIAGGFEGSASNSNSNFEDAQSNPNFSRPTSGNLSINNFNTNTSSNVTEIKVNASTIGGSQYTLNNSTSNVAGVGIVQANTKTIILGGSNDADALRSTSPTSQTQLSTNDSSSKTAVDMSKYAKPYDPNDSDDSDSDFSPSSTNKNNNDQESQPTPNPLSKMESNSSVMSSPSPKTEAALADLKSPPQNLHGNDHDDERGKDGVAVTPMSPTNAATTLEAAMMMKPNNVLNPMVFL
jgi:hypothetical protein